MPGELSKSASAPTQDLARLGALVRRYRQIRGHSQNNLSKEVDCNRATISNIENGKHRASHELLTRILDVLEIPESDRPQSKSKELFAGTPEFHARSRILSGMIHGKFAANGEDFHAALARYDDREYRGIALTPDSLRRVIESLAADGFLRHTGSGNYVYQPAVTRIDTAFLVEYELHIRSLSDRMQGITSISTARNISRQVRDTAASLSDDDSPETFYAVLESAHLAIAGQELCLRHLTIGHAAAIRQLHSICYSAIVEPRSRFAFHGRYTRIVLDSLAETLYASMETAGPGQRVEVMIQPVPKQSEPTRLRDRIASLMQEYLPAELFSDYAQAGRLSIESR